MLVSTAQDLPRRQKGYVLVPPIHDPACDGLELARCLHLVPLCRGKPVGRMDPDVAERRDAYSAELCPSGGVSRRYFPIHSISGLF